MIFVNGLQRSGTNFAHQIYQGSVQWCMPYWKHDPKMEGIDPPCDKVVCIIKNPYTWVESICFRNQVDIVQWFPSYRLRDQNDFLGPFNINLIRLVRLYKCFYTSWLNYDKTELVHYEDLLLLNKIDRVPMSDDWDESRKAQYINGLAPLVPQKAKKIITDQLGQKFFDKIGYEMI